MTRRRITIGLLAAALSVSVAAPTASARTSAPVPTAPVTSTSTSGDAMCLAIQPYVGYCVGNVLDALLKDL